MLDALSSWRRRVREAMTDLDLVVQARSPPRQVQAVLLCLHWDMRVLRAREHNFSLEPGAATQRIHA